MDSNREIDKKLNKIKHSKENYVVFKMEYKGEVVEERKVTLSEYGKEVMNSDVSFYYWFKDWANSFEDKIVKEHKELIWNKSQNGGSDGKED